MQNKCVYPSDFKLWWVLTLSPQFICKWLCFLKFSCKNLSKKFPTRSYVWETVDMLHASFNRIIYFLPWKNLLPEIFQTNFIHIEIFDNISSYARFLFRKYDKNVTRLVHVICLRYCLEIILKTSSCWNNILFNARQ